MNTMTELTQEMSEAPEVSAPSISSSAMLVELSISVWTGRKKDRKAQAKLEADSHAARGVTNVTKKLLGDHPLLDKIQKHAATVRTTVHYPMTMPWSDMALRLLPTKMYFKYNQLMDEARQEHEAMRDEFLHEYEFDVADLHMRQQSLGTLFDPSEYPSANDLYNKFGFRLNYIPMPESGDFRLDIANDAQNVLRSAYADFYQRKTVEAMNHIWQRLYDTLSHTAERLADPEPGFEGMVTKDGRKKFSENLIEDMAGMVEILKLSNITDDEKMRRMERKLSDALFGVTTEAIKEDPDLRRDTKRQLDEAIAALPSLDW